jgi:hypothetical protein
VETRSGYCRGTIAQSAFLALKVFERIILKRLNTFVSTNKRSQGQSTGMLLLDVEKAFDFVWHDALLHKLIHILFLMGVLFRSVSVSPSRSSVIFHMAYLRVPFYLQPYIMLPRPMGVSLRHS